jgi:hypothetical protein
VAVNCFANSVARNALGDVLGKKWAATTKMLLGAFSLIYCKLIFKFSS